MEKPPHHRRTSRPLPPRDKAQSKALVRENKALLDNDFVGVVFVRGRRIMRTNHHAETLFGYAPGELIGHSTAILYPDHAAFLALGNRAGPVIVRGEVFSDQVELARKDGSRFWCLLRGQTLAPAAPLTQTIWILEDVTERKRAEAVIQASLAFQKQLLEAIPTPVFFKGLDGRYQIANRAFIELAGGSETALIGRTIYDCWPLETADIFATRDQALFDHPGVQVYETQIKNRRGERRDVVFHKATLNAPDGHLAGLIGFVLDITEHKAAETVLRASEERYRSALLALTEGVTVYDRQGTLVTANPAAERILGLSTDKFRERSIDAADWRIIRGDGTAFPPDEWPSVVTLNTGIAQREVLMGVFKSDGRLSWILVNTEPIRDPLTGSLQAAVVSFDDITARKGAEDALRASEERLQLVLEGANDGFWDWDLSTGAVLFSPRWARMLGYEPAEVQPHIRIWRRLMHPADHRRARAALLAHFAGATPRFEIEHRMLTKHGDWRWFLHRGKVTARDAAGRPLRMAGTHTDITERRDMEEALRVGLAGLQRHDSQMVGLNRMSELLLSCETRTEAYTVIARSAARLFVGLGGALAVLGEAAGSDLRVAASWGEPGALPTTFPAGHCWALRRGAIHEVNELTPGARCRHLSDPPPPAHLCLPLTVRGDTLGLLHLRAPAALTAAAFADLRTLAVAFSEAAKLALSNIRLQETLREQAIRDSLTGLFNRRYLDETLPRELQLSRRRGEPLAAAMLDLDHFKRFNDAYGHEAGDAVLRAVGALLAGSVRGGDVACRYGGEELTLILPGATLAAARERLEGLRQAIMQTRVLYQGGELPAITVSIGVTVAGGQETDAAAVLTRADAALFRAKASGRNRVVAVAP
ncbi:PAS domain S-box protein [Candidatus Thiodictyon syntrophicum]|jgi:diguanylate cyclase (GGDEF)-like protein/PAS domain S-box-containing protein|nr:PAS domain S-box protein [Candidatus Thiodictyon syntrophicum]